MGDTLFKWVLKGKFEVCALNMNYLSAKAKINIEVFETALSSEIKREHRSDYDTIQLPVPRHNKVLPNSRLLEEQIKKCLNKICEIRENTVAVDLDHVYSWHLEDFVNIFLSCLNEFKDGKFPLKFLRLYFCAFDRTKFEVATKACGGFCTLAKEKQSKGATSSPTGLPTSSMAAVPLNVVVKEGPLEKANVDVIACTVGSYVDLTSGAASKALHAASGYKLQKMMERENSKKPFEIGEIAVLDIDVNSGLNCKKVFFGTLYFTKFRHEDMFSKQKFFDQLNVHEFMMRCLEKADRLDQTSIAFPAIGAGGKGYLVDFVAEQMFETASLFQPKKRLKSVIFFVYEKSAVQAFKKAETNCHSAISDTRLVPSKPVGEGPKMKESFTNTARMSSGGNVSLPQIGHEVKEAALGMLEDQEWEFFKLNYMDFFPVTIDKLKLKDRRLYVLGTENEIANMKETLLVFERKIRELRTDQLNMTDDVYTLLKDKIDKRCKEDRIQCVFVNSILYIYGSWSTNLLLRFREDICELAKQASISTKQNAMNTRDALKSMSSSNDQSLNGARPKHSLTSHQSGFPEGAADLREIWTSERIRVCVYSCDILKTRVDCIVNAANGNLNHDAGIARAIVLKAGHALDAEGQALLKTTRRGCIEVGEACHTGAGNLQYKFVIHAVGPMWSDYKAYSDKTVKMCEEKLESAIFNSLTEAEELRMTSVAIPSISSGVFGVPKQICAVAYARAVRDYSKLSQKPLLEVHFVDLDDKMVKLVQDAFREIITLNSLPSWYNMKDILRRTAGMSTQRKAEDPTHSPKTDSPRSSKPGGSGTKPGGLSNNTGKSPHQSASTDTTFCFEGEIFGTSTRALTFHLSPMQVLHVYSEDLLGTTMPKVDMLVCSDNLKATEKGYLVGTLRTTAGKKYTDEKDKAFKKTGLKQGEVIVCNGGNTRYTYIAVVVMHVFSTSVPKSEKKMKYLALYRNIFKTAVEKGIGSVALSALGTGSGTMKPEHSIVNFAEGLLDFFRQNKTQKLCVHFVNKKTEINILAKTLIQKTWNMRPQQHVNIGAPSHAKSSDARSEINENSMFQDQMANPQMRKQSNDSSPTNNLKENVDGKHINQRRTSTFARSMSIPSTVPAEHKTDSNPKRFSASLMVQHGNFDPTMLAFQISKGGGGGNLPMFETNDNQAANGNNMQPTDPVLNKTDRRETTPPHISSSGGDMHSLGMEQSKEPMPGPDDNCVICMDKLKNPKMLKCGHTFCSDCIDQQFVYKEACPACGTVHGVIKGDQPDGTMELRINEREHCAGFDRCGRIEINYNFCDGTQTSSHPNPGKPYKGIRRTAYLPNNSRGRKIAEMLRVAFERKLVFTIGSSRTTGKEDVITWNDIHHKTDHKPNSQFGYPDATYLDRVTEELKVKGITEDDISSKRR